MKTITKSARLSLKSKTNTLLGAVLFLLVIGATAPARAQVWQASTDFSTVQGYRNWRYMTYLAGAGGDPGTYEPMVYGQNLYGFDSWHYEFLYGDYIVGGFMHPSGLETARIWESPVAGTVRVTGSAAKWDQGGGDGVYVTIWQNGSLVWDAAIAFDDGIGYSYDLPVGVQPGDWLVFRVDDISDQLYDSTVFDPRIAVESLDGPSGGSWMEAALRDMSSYVEGLDLNLFEGPTTNARAGRRLALSHGLTVAANHVDQASRSDAISQLWTLTERLNGDPSPPDWMVNGPEKEALNADIWQLIHLLGQP